MHAPSHEVRAQLTAPGQPFETHVVDVDGVSFTIVEERAEQSGGDPRSTLRHSRTARFIVHEGQRFTFAEHYAERRHHGASTRSNTVIESGDRVAIAARNLPQGIVDLLGRARRGGRRRPAQRVVDERGAGVRAE